MREGTEESKKAFPVLRGELRALFDVKLKLNHGIHSSQRFPTM